MSRFEFESLSEGVARLRMLRRSDLPLTLAWRNDPRSRRWFHSDAEIAWDKHVAWFERYLDRAEDHVFVLDDGGHPVAQVSLYGVEKDAAEFGRLLVDPSARGAGHGGVASRLCLRVADEVLGLSRVHLEVKVENATAIRIYEGLGFVATPSATTPADSIFMVRDRTL